MHCGICLHETRCIEKMKHQQFTLWHCVQCDGQFWDPMQNPGASWYEHDERYADRNADPQRKPVDTHRAFLKDAPAAKGKVLDVGMGTGNFLHAAKQKGYQVWGIDFDSHAIEVAKRVSGIEHAYVASLEQLRTQCPQERFDVVTLFEVLEHADAPGELIDTIYEILAPGGYVAISVPYRRGHPWFIPSDLPPRHLSRWNRSAMRVFLESHGFQVVRFKRFRASLSHVVTKFHFWTRGYLSFGLIGKLKHMHRDPEAPGVIVQPTVTISPPLARRSKGISALHFLAKAKDYLLFTIPALALMAYTALIGRQHIGMYVLAKKIENAERVV